MSYEKPIISIQWIEEAALLCNGDLVVSNGGGKDYEGGDWGDWDEGSDGEW